MRQRTSAPRSRWPRSRGCGCEIARLEWSEISTGKHPLIRVVEGKGGHGRVIPLSQALGRELDYLPHRRGPVIPRRDGLPGPNAPHRVSTYVNDYLHGIGITETLHQCRHRFATVSYQACRDIRAVQQLMGHASPTTTSMYAEAASVALAEAVHAAGTVDGFDPGLRASRHPLPAVRPGDDGRGDRRAAAPRRARIPRRGPAHSGRDGPGMARATSARGRPDRIGRRPPPCPDWCAHRLSHPYEVADPVSQVVYRTHSNGEDTTATIYQLESNMSGGVVHLDPPTLSLWIDGDMSGELTADQARDVAASLLAAADDLDRLA